MMGPRARAAAIANARREILAAVEVALEAEKRKIVAAMSPARIRTEVAALIQSHTELLDYIDAIERWPRIGEELKQLRVRGEIPWPL
jgi:hypothetical protein